MSPLTPEDIVPDEPLRGTGKSHVAPEQDLLHHRVIARRIAELASSASGKVNIALFGPWGSGKSSFKGTAAAAVRAAAPSGKHPIATAVGDKKRAVPTR